MQAARFDGGTTRYNADMTHRQTRQFCQLDDECQNLLKAAMTELGLSARAHDKILRVARTIADLDQQRRHPADASQRGDQLPDAGSAVVDVRGVNWSRRQPMAQTAEQTTVLPDVLTLAEAAAYLRVSETEIVELMRRQGLPGRKIGTQWRFLKAAIQDWMRFPEKENFWWRQFGALKGDPHLEEMVEQIYHERGRPISERKRDVFARLGHLSLLHAGHERIGQRREDVDPADVATTIVTKAEILRARCEFLLKAADTEQLVRTQLSLRQRVKTCCGLFESCPSTALHHRRVR